MYNIYEEKEFLSLKMFSFIGHGYDLASFQCYLYNRDMFSKPFTELQKYFRILFTYSVLWRMKSQISNWFAYVYT